MIWILDIILTGLISIFAIFMAIFYSPWWLLLIPIRFYYIAKDDETTNVNEKDQECNINIKIEVK